ncbi:hypothetical protein Sgleb_49120 [Streptomyces glebosus]|uniref:Uncharacterized protein n=1 Tax=Streptomyces glebosus TaxID=249580 RepID=A0A640T5F4_9ACTN|nr:hypothetical protein Sgleb_49120 [Streptomyces glebosus]GHG86472.1 hypothetical protein GCM10010513_67790 [Streptomyces glebosus]
MCRPCTPKRGRRFRKEERNSRRIAIRAGCRRIIAVGGFELARPLAACAAIVGHAGTPKSNELGPAPKVRAPATV